MIRMAGNGFNSDLPLQVDPIQRHLVISPWNRCHRRILAYLSESPRRILRERYSNPLRYAKGQPKSRAVVLRTYQGVRRRLGGAREP